MRVLHTLTMLYVGFLFVASPIEVRGAQESSAKTTSFVVEKGGPQNAEAKLREGLSLKRIYKKVVSAEEFEHTKKQDSTFQSRSINTSGVRVVHQLSPDEIVYYKENSTDKKEEEKVVFPNEAEFPVVYKTLVNSTEFSQLIQEIRDGTKVRYSLSKLGDLVILAERSPIESNAMAVMKVKPSDTFPNFYLPSNTDTQLSNQIFQGKLTLINFFFDKCKPCIEETPELNSFAKNNPKIQVLAMTFDRLDAAKEYAQKHQFEWQIASEARGLISKDLGVKGFPSFALVDASGKILGISGALEIGAHKGTVETALQAWIKKLSAVPST